MSDEVPAAEAPTDHAPGATLATGGAAAVPEPSGDGRNAGASGSILGVRDGPATLVDERQFAGGNVQAHEPTAGAKRRKRITPQSSTQQVREALQARQHAFARGIGGIGVEPRKEGAKPEREPEATRDDAGPMAPVTASALRTATAAHMSHIPVFEDRQRASKAARAYDTVVAPSDVVAPSCQSRREPARERTERAEKRTDVAPPRALPKLLPRPPATVELVPPERIERSPIAHDAMIQEKIDAAVERNRLQRAAEMAVASAAIHATQAERAHGDQDRRDAVSAKQTPATSALDRALAVLRDEDPTDTNRFFVASPAERCQMLIQRKDTLQEELERVVGVLEMECVMRAAVEEALAKALRGEGQKEMDASASLEKGTSRASAPSQSR